MHTHILLNYKSFHIKSSLLEPAKRVPPARLGPIPSFGYVTLRYGTDTGTMLCGTIWSWCWVRSSVPAGCEGYWSCLASPPSCRRQSWYMGDNIKAVVKAKTSGRKSWVCVCECGECVEMCVCVYFLFLFFFLWKTQEKLKTSLL